MKKWKIKENKKVLAGVLALLGYLGIHKFILGYTKEGIIQIVITLVSCGLKGIIPFIEGIIYLTNQTKILQCLKLVEKVGSKNKKEAFSMLLFLI